jgi:predicted transcriptional regulator
MASREWNAQRNEVGNPPLPVRLSPELRQRVVSRAAEDFNGNVSGLIRAALEIYIDLRERRAAEQEKAA